MLTMKSHRTRGRAGRGLLGSLVALATFLLIAATSDALSLNVFKNPQPWTKRIDSLPKDELSDVIIGQLVELGGFGRGHIQMDFSLNVAVAGPGTRKRAFTRNDDFWSPDCDCAAVPVPAKVAVEGSTNSVCPGFPDGDDCHLLVLSPSEGRLYGEFTIMRTIKVLEGLETDCLIARKQKCTELQSPTTPSLDSALAA